MTKKKSQVERDGGGKDCPTAKKVATAKDNTQKDLALAQKMKNLRKKNQQHREDTVADDAGKDPVAEGSMKGKKNKEKQSESCSKNVRKKGGKKKKGTLRTCDETVETDTGSHRPQKKIRHVPTNKAQVDNYHQFMIEACNVGVNGIIKQFNDYLKAYVPPGVTTKAFEKNGDKNRYKDVVCLDGTRVCLKGGKSENDYIHANMVDGEPLCNKFIACQGPLHNTTYDFWRMVIQEKSQNIFMLCQTIEMEKEKCHQYWPKDKGCAMTFKDITIRNIDVDTTTDNTSVITQLQVSVGTKEPVLLHHYRWRDWPDRSVPQSILAPFRLLKVSRTSKGATIVHCSAGVGRTGAIIGIELALQSILTGKPTNMTQVVQELRMKRMHCVQTDIQLVYMYRCLIAYAEASGLLKNHSTLPSRIKTFVHDYDTLIADRLSSGKPKLPPSIQPSSTQPQHSNNPPSKESMPPPSPAAQSPMTGSPLCQSPAASPLPASPENNNNNQFGGQPGTGGAVSPQVGVPFKPDPGFPSPPPNGANNGGDQLPPKSDYF